MRYSCVHSSPCLVDNSAAKTKTQRASCGAVIAALERDNATLRSDLEQCLDILRDARMYTEEVERVLVALPAFVAHVKDHLQRLMLLQHGVFLESATVQFRLWHKDREDLLDAFDAEAQHVYEAHQSRVDHLIEQQEGELEDVHAEWRLTLDSMKLETSELKRQLESYEHAEQEEREEKHFLLKRAAEVIERRQRVVGRNVGTQVIRAVSVAASQTADVYFRSVAVQTMGRPTAAKQRLTNAAPPSSSSSRRQMTVDDGGQQEEKEEAAAAQQPQLVQQQNEEMDPEPETNAPSAHSAHSAHSAPAAAGVAAPTKSSEELVAEETTCAVQCEGVTNDERQEEEQHDSVELTRLSLEMRRIELECALEREAAATARLECTVLTDKLHDSSREILFLRGALDRIESRLFLPTARVTTAVAREDITMLEHLALDGGDGLNQTPQADSDGTPLNKHALPCDVDGVNAASAYFTQLQKELVTAVHQVARRAVEKEWRATLLLMGDVPRGPQKMSSSLDMERHASSSGSSSCVGGPPTLHDWITAARSAQHWSRAFKTLHNNLRSLMDSAQEKGVLLESRGWEQRITTKVWTDHVAALARAAGAAEGLPLCRPAASSSATGADIVQHGLPSGRHLKRTADGKKHHKFRSPYAPLRRFGS